MQSTGNWDVQNVVGAVISRSAFQKYTAGFLYRANPLLDLSRCLLAS